MNQRERLPDRTTNLAQSLIDELAGEGDATRRVLARVPAEHLSWKPHPKSMSLGALAWHVAVLPRAITELVSQSPREIPDVPQVEASSVEELLELLDTSISAATQALTRWGEAGLDETWTMTRHGEVLLELPRREMIRTVMLNHWYHHRGQLSVYLRLLDVPLPSIYGGSADEPMF